jgi:hypothetical protein
MKRHEWQLELKIGSKQKRDKENKQSPLERRAHPYCHNQDVVLSNKEIYWDRRRKRGLGNVMLKWAKRQ